MLIRLAHGKDLARISRELRRMDDRELKKRFRQELRAAAAPLVPAVRASIAAIPVKGTSGSTGLRQRLQKATRLQVRTAGRNAMVRIRVDGARMPSGERSLPEMMEGTKRWRHPTYGHEPWKTQDPHPYFFKVVRPLGTTSRVAVNRVVDSITRDIT